MCQVLYLLPVNDISMQLQLCARVVHYLSFMLKTRVCCVVSDCIIPLRKSVIGNFQWKSFHLMAFIFQVFIHFSYLFDIPCLS